MKLIKLVLHVANRLDISLIQVKHGFPGNRYVKIHIHDVGTHFTFKLSEGKLKFVTLPPRIDVNIHMATLCTLKHLRFGYIAGYHPVTSQRTKVRYTLMDAWRYGDIVTNGDASTNDMLAFMDLFIEAMASVSPGKITSIIGDCIHDITMEQTEVTETEVIPRAIT